MFTSQKERLKIDTKQQRLKIQRFRVTLKKDFPKQYFKSTGSVVGQQWFGGARKSGTNDKAGGPLYTSRFISPQAIKRTHVPIHDWSYPSMSEE